MTKAKLSPDLQSLLSRIRERLDITGKSERGASEAAGLSSSTIRNIREGKVASPRLETLRRLAGVLDTTVEWLAFGSEPMDQSASASAAIFTSASMSEADFEGPGIVNATFLGTVEAGVFRPVEDFPDEHFIGEPTLRDVDFPSARLLSFTAAGDSMDNLKPFPILPGVGVTALDVRDARVTLRDGMVVVVERTTGDGRLCERSLKQVELYEGRTELCPRSANGQHKPLVFPANDLLEDRRDVKVLGIVRRISAKVPLS